MNCPLCSAKLQELTIDGDRHLLFHEFIDSPRRSYWIYNSKNDRWTNCGGGTRKWNALRMHWPSKEYLSLIHKWRPVIFARDGKKCRACGSEKRINCHHIEEKHLFSRLENSFTDSNLITLCDRCHKLLQTADKRMGKELRILRGRIKRVCTEQSKRPKYIVLLSAEMTMQN